MRMLAALVCWMMLGCGDSESHAQMARQRYNEGLLALGANEWEKAEKDLLAARDEAGADSALRYQAAFNLGMAYAGEADSVATEDPEKAVELLSQSAAWFRDALGRRTNDEDAKINLELVANRRRLLVDELNKGKNKLEVRLEELIAEQRTFRDDVRGLVAKVASAKDGADPVQFQRDFESMAIRERTLLSQAGTVSDRAADELHLLNGKGEQELSDQERMRQVQLKNLEHYLGRARSGLAEARRALRKLRGGPAHDRADAALTELKRAREQLQDPVTVLRGIAEEQTVLFRQTMVLDKIKVGELKLSGSDVPAKAPPWLTGEHLATRQEQIESRRGELAARLEAGTKEKADPEAETDVSPEQKRTLELVREALPFVQEAGDAMRSAHAHLGSNLLTEATEAQTKALKALFAAMERFADIRQLIELAYAEQAQIATQLAPPAEGEKKEPLGDAAVSEVKLGVARNQGRLQRLGRLFEDELAALALDAQTQQPQAQAQGQAPSPEEAEQKKQMFQHAESLRKEALSALDRMNEQLAHEPAVAAKDKIEELRRLFYSIIEHLKELHQNQTETHDRTATAHAVTDEERASSVGPLADAQARHAQIGEQLAAALEQQADAAAQQPAQPAQGAQGQHPQGADQAQRLADAAVEVREAVSDMGVASDNLKEAADNAATLSVALQPAMDAQPSAIEHLAKAIELTALGATIDATEAHRIGLVNQVFPADEFEAGVEAYLDGLRKLSRPVIRMAKRATTLAAREQVLEHLEQVERMYLDELMKLSDAHEGIAAFLEKRAPVWKHG